ncbi:MULTISPECIES: Asp-tRNA(Asn)/Glu-tRNA(Gln) amidotransferase subunit GatC [Mammaliicoccus]|uniref:Aspartyl/glutamyl-tRNA(Asn/Gln) amidotransferase subunit C n=1 Tax=Mammaliicoccus fleurettii TaxID=150056 RepID=A0ABS5MNL6_9STAP|nr:MULTISPECIES: Asp-tRNA(Asn)/Glu-tRNA(Gln) amidotransferase subunit GatC [Mammaliicoccus]HCN61032.1 Asp-tRNA(Asn)/Glu-tRNA(Gln) amidotransferase subunit GatC [Staphylococcus sp.]MBL0846699.1 Asp-tRNA(Asn)/Glu-tRNA(Gln) amidotransferase subunit GatC [Mammaliicoccus fleurettii]MBO3062074.1 Asp-tRNA(Asn)/Glu-tRNA(Gln) amidotransferase subunit GatC [Mammaliicoccus fleurettii]MBS3672591.1 Asp-tRNA(Asn)/Glu-tRNA(Gln) amidotransferase subunit GatC [Mammaliicoccus fleurettii]MBS3697513.1 Asp-tRNA(As
MTKVTSEQVEHVANLARLEVSQDEVNEFTKSLEKILNFAGQLDEVDTENVEPTFHVLDLQNVLREDKSELGIPQEQALLNAKEKEAGQFKVPAIMNEED